MKQTTSIDTEALCEKYLGLPAMVRHSTTEAFEPILAKIRGLVGGWSEKIVTPQVFSSIIALHCMSISMHHFILIHVVATNVICL
jgi:hypothetical protein